MGKSLRLAVIADPQSMQIEGSRGTGDCEKVLSPNRNSFL